jgi:hypothetical protein
MGEYQASRIHRVYYCFPSINTIFQQSDPIPINCIKAPILELWMLWNSRTVLFSARRNKFSKKRMIMILVGSNSIFVFQVIFEFTFPLAETYAIVAAAMAKRKGETI